MFCQSVLWATHKWTGLSVSILFYLFIFFLLVKWFPVKWNYMGFSGILEKMECKLYMVCHEK